MKTAHFNVDYNLKKYLTGCLFPFSLCQETLAKIPKEKIEIISVRSQSQMDKYVLENLPKLKLLITRTVGLDHIDVKMCQERGIIVRNIPDYGASNIAEHAFALLLAGSRKIVQADREVHKGKFSYENYLGAALKGKTLGVIGTGRIGLELIKRAKAFEMNILAYDILKNERATKEIKFHYVSLDNLLKTSDFISLHVPLLPKTKYMIGGREIRKMKQGVILINTSRGEIINTADLIKYIKKFSAVCLDVVEDEKNFSVKNPLLKFDNVIITPHIAFYTDESIERIAQITQDYIKNFERKK
jgi:lactate dehydrogenase-like 2-hydroxyacid dehydrogenase